MMKRILKVSAAVLAVVGLVFVSGCGKKSASGKNAFIVGTEPTFPPFELTDAKTGEITGFDIELIKAIAADQGFEVDVRNLGFDGLIPALQSGNIAIVASGMTITEEREKQVDFSAPYIDAGLAIATSAANTAINGKADLKGKTAAVQIGTSGSKAAEELQKEGLLVKVKTFDTVAVAMQELVSGGVDVVINDLPVTKAYMVKQPGKIRLAGEPLNSESYGFAVKTGNKELLDKINAGLASVKANGTYDKLQNKYFE
jgi:polar amino acid transport system substrate-binding protein